MYIYTEATVLSTRLTSCKPYVLRKRTFPKLTLSLSQLLLHSVLLLSFVLLCFYIVLTFGVIHKSECIDAVLYKKVWQNVAVTVFMHLQHDMCSVSIITIKLNFKTLKFFTLWLLALRYIEILRAFWLADWESKSAKSRVWTSFSVDSIASPTSRSRDVENK